MFILNTDKREKFVRFFFGCQLDFSGKDSTEIGMSMRLHQE
jgi:hypothetical protein